MPLYTGTNLKAWCCVPKLCALTLPQWPKLIRNPECGTGAHDPESISYENTIYVHYELIWIMQLELLFVHL